MNKQMGANQTYKLWTAKETKKNKKIENKMMEE